MQDIKSCFFWQKMYTIIILIGFLITASQVPDSKNLLVAFGYLILLLISFIAGVYASVLIWIQQDNLKKITAKIIEEHEKLLQKAIQKVTDYMVRRLSFKQIEKLREDAKDFIQNQTKDFYELMSIYDVKSLFVREILTDEFRRRLKVWLQEPKQPTKNELTTMGHRAYPND
jgi:hypothetical protein